MEQRLITPPHRHSSTYMQLIVGLIAVIKVDIVAVLRAIAAGEIKYMWRRAKT